MQRSLPPRATTPINGSSPFSERQSYMIFKVHPSVQYRPLLTNRLTKVAYFRLDVKVRQMKAIIARNSVPQLSRLLPHVWNGPHLMEDDHAVVVVIANSRNYLSILKKSNCYSVGCICIKSNERIRESTSRWWEVPVVTNVVLESMLGNHFLRFLLFHEVRHVGDEVKLCFIQNRLP